MPWHVVFGNHDLVGVQPPEGAGQLAEPRAVFREVFGLERTWRRLELGGHSFFLLDTVEVLEDRSHYRGICPPAQLAWLREELAATAPEHPLVLVSHIPLRTTALQVSDGVFEPLKYNLAVANAGELLGLFAGHNLRAVLQGHLHVNETIRFNGLPFVMGGAGCGRWWKGPRLGTEEGFGVMTFPANGPSGWQYHDIGWDVPATAGA